MRSDAAVWVAAIVGVLLGFSARWIDHHLTRAGVALAHAYLRRTGRPVPPPPPPPTCHATLYTRDGFDLRTFACRFPEGHPGRHEARSDGPSGVIYRWPIPYSSAPPPAPITGETTNREDQP